MGACHSALTYYPPLHVYKNRKGKRKVKEKDRAEEDNRNTDDSIKGSRIINMEQLQQYTEDLRQHSIQCEGTLRAWHLSSQVAAPAASTPSLSRHQRKSRVLKATEGK